jgi:hypothetical protein
MNFIFGVILLALFIMAVRVIWTTVLQTIVYLKSGLLVLKQLRAQRSARLSVLSTPVVMPCLPHPIDWHHMANNLRQEIHQRNTGFCREAHRLDAQLQVTLKTIELFKADIQLTKLEQELLKIKPAVMLQEPEAVKKRRRSKSQSAVVVEDITAKTPAPVQQLRAALKGSKVLVDSPTGNVRH